MKSIPSLKYKTILVILNANITSTINLPHECVLLLSKLWKDIRNPSNDLFDNYEDEDHKDLLILYYLNKCESMNIEQIINNRNSDHYLWACLHQTRINDYESDLIQDLDIQSNSRIKSYTVNNAFYIENQKNSRYKYKYQYIVASSDKPFILYDLAIIDNMTHLPEFCVVNFKNKAKTKDISIIVNYNRLPELFTRNNPWLCYVSLCVNLYYSQLVSANEFKFTSEIFEKNVKLTKNEYHVEILNSKFLTY